MRHLHFVEVLNKFQKSTKVGDEQDLAADFEIAAEDSNEVSAFTKAKEKSAHLADLRLQLLGGPERFKYNISFAVF